MGVKGSKDIFIDVTVLRRSVLDGRVPCQSVRITIAQGRRAFEVPIHVQIPGPTRISAQSVHPFPKGTVFVQC
jgi:hypothetical protein